MGKVLRALSKAAESDKSQMLSDESTLQGLDKELFNEASNRQSDNQRTSSDLWDERFILASSTTGATAESIRTLRTRILYPVMGETPRTLLITSASPGEGKSFICANLALSLAQGVDDYCILVDCDLRRPTQHKLFGLKNERGLADHLQGGVPPEDLITHSGVKKLSILPAGPPPINPAELSGSGSMVHLVNELKSRYEDRFVLLDSPPLGAATETAVLAQHVDGVILVIRQGTARREHVKHLVDTIGREKILGVVFNAHEVSVLDTAVFGYTDYKAGYYYQK